MDIEKIGKYIVHRGNHCKEEWFVNDDYHREDGPAVVHNDDSCLWFLDGRLVYSDFVDNTDKFDMSDEMKLSIVMHKLKYG